jgi:hypothetical protein
MVVAQRRIDRHGFLGMPDPPCGAPELLPAAAMVCQSRVDGGGVERAIGVSAVYKRAGG